MRQAMLNNVLVDLDTLTKPEIMGLSKSHDFSCVKCAKPVIFKNGTRKIAHFAHEKNRIATGQSESTIHILVKHALANWLERQGCVPSVERRFPQIDRIADVYFEFRNRPYVLEIQKSPMSDPEYQQRIADYQKLNITVIWIFLGSVVKKNNVYKLPPVMQGRNSERLFHFCSQTAKMTIFEHPTFVTTSSIYAQSICKSLANLQVENLISAVNKQIFLDDSWLGVKQKFRERGWYYHGRNERKLIEYCILQGFNLALLPTEIGWPVAGNIIRSPLFIWQASVLITIMRYIKINDKFNISCLMNLLEFEFGFPTTTAARQQVKGYLNWLIMFGILAEKGRLFQYVKSPKISRMMEDNLQHDRCFVFAVVKLWKR